MWHLAGTKMAGFHGSSEDRPAFPSLETMHGISLVEKNQLTGSILFTKQAVADPEGLADPNSVCKAGGLL